MQNLFYHIARGIDILQVYALTNLIDQRCCLLGIALMRIGLGLHQQDISQTQLVAVLIRRTALVHEWIVRCWVVVVPSALVVNHALVETNLVAFLGEVANQVARWGNPLSPCKVVLVVIQLATVHPGLPVTVTCRIVNLENTLAGVALHAILLVGIVAKQGSILWLKCQTCSCLYLLGILNNLAVILHRALGINLGQHGLSHRLSEQGAVGIRELWCIWQSLLKILDNLLIALLGSLLWRVIGRINFLYILVSDGLGNIGDDRERAPQSGHIKHDKGTEDLTFGLPLATLGIAYQILGAQFVETVDEHISLGHISQIARPVAAQNRV